MSICRVALLALASLPLLAASASAQQKPTGAELIASKCFQCHTQAMWQDQRQDTRAWARRALEHRGNQADGRVSRHQFRASALSVAGHLRDSRDKP
jgi:cytochrome c5